MLIGWQLDWSGHAVSEYKRSNTELAFNAHKLIHD